MQTTETLKAIHMAQPKFSEAEQAEILAQTSDILENRLSMGPNVVAFQNEFAESFGVKHAIAVNSCTSALEISLRYLDLQAGDEVIVPSQTFIATGMAAHLSGGKLVFAEIEPDTMSLDLNDVIQKLSKRTRAIIVVHFSGFISPDIFKLRSLAEEKNILLIEDAAHTPGAMRNGQYAGSIGDVGCFSFYPTKILTCGEGGMLTTNNDDIAEYAHSMQNRGREMANTQQECYDKAFRNVRFQEFSAVLGRTQLKSIHDNIKTRQNNAKRYADAFSSISSIQTLRFDAYSDSACWKFPILLDKTIDRNAVVDTLHTHKIFADISYDPPLHLQPIVQELGYGKAGLLPITEETLNRHLCLPCHPHLNDTDISRVIDTVKQGLHAQR